ncbi:MAG: histidine kinase [Nostocoides sp.]
MSSTSRPSWRATGYGVGHLLMAVPLALLLSWAAICLGLAVIGVGIPLARPLGPAIAVLARANARMAGSFLGREVPVAALLKAVGGPWRATITWFGVRAWWQLMLWLLFACSGGLVLSAVAAAVPVGVLALIITALSLSVSGSAPASVPVLLVVAAVMLGPLWWFCGGAVMRLRTQIEAAILSPDPSQELERRVADLTLSRADSLDSSAAELRRIERDLHDGAQARLVSLGMSLGMAVDLLDRNPELARKLLLEARDTTGAALGDLRAVVRGIHPPVLADRGLIGAVQALAVDLPIPVTVDAALPGRAPEPVESAAYFAIAECLANVVKHSGASCAWIVIAAPGGRLRLVVGDDGRGGAHAARGTGLVGVARRLAAFDGTMELASPDGGPTVVTMEVSCEWWSPRITPSYGTA